MISKSLVKIAVTSPPKKSIYVEGTTFNFTGMVVTSTYNNGTTEVVKDYSYSSASLSLGTTVFSISYIENGISAVTTTPIKVIDKELLSLSIEYPPQKTEYIEGNNFNSTGLVIRAHYDNGISELIYNYTYSKEPLIKGATSIEISYSKSKIILLASENVKLTENLCDVNIHISLNAKQNCYNGDYITIPNNYTTEHLKRAIKYIEKISC